MSILLDKVHPHKQKSASDIIYSHRQKPAYTLSMTKLHRIYFSHTKRRVYILTGKNPSVYILRQKSMYVFSTTKKPGIF